GCPRGGGGGRLGQGPAGRSGAWGKGPSTPVRVQVRRGGWEGRPVLSARWAALRCRARPPAPETVLWDAASSVAYRGARHRFRVPSAAPPAARSARWEQPRPAAVGPSAAVVTAWS